MENPKPRILVLLSRVPYPLDKGDKLRAFKQLEGLSKYFRIILVCAHIGKLHEKALENLNPLCENVHIIYLNPLGIAWRLVSNLGNSTPFQVAFFHSKQAQKEFDAIVEKYLPQRYYVQLIRMAEYTRKYTIYHKTLDYMDALSLGMERRISTAPFFIKPWIRSEAKRLKAYESKVFSEFQKKTIISSKDRDAIEHLQASDIEVIPNGIGSEYFLNIETETLHDLCFTGNMSYPPNIAAAQYLAKEILPKVKNYPSLKVVISGKRPAKAVKKLRSQRIEVTGWVEDMKVIYASSKIFVAPMKIGSGLQNKLLEAMASGLPCITTPLANDALGAENGKHILLAESPQDFANHIDFLIENPNARLNLGKAGQEFVKTNFSWEYWNNKLANILLENSANYA